MIIKNLSVKGETFNKLKKEKKVELQLQSIFKIDEKICVSNRETTMDPIMAVITKKEKIESSSPHQKFFYIIECI